MRNDRFMFNQMNLLTFSMLFVLFLSFINNVLIYKLRIKISLDSSFEYLSYTLCFLYCKVVYNLKEREVMRVWRKKRISESEFELESS